MTRPIFVEMLFVAALLSKGAVVTAAPVDFVKDIQPVLEKKCLSCHNPNSVKGDIDLSTAELVLDPEAELVIPGKAMASDLYLVSTPEEPGEKPYMPEEGDPLTDKEAELLQRWIDKGAEWPEGIVLREASEADKSWWAYQELPDEEAFSVVLANPDTHPIDAFIEAKLEAEGLEMNSPAERRDLIRRATYDLTGLPPTPEEVETFVASDDPKAYDKLIDRLLASPHYGERWGRHWLDVVRFGESRGYERNQIIDNLWPFRDYVIESINDDKPFDEFIREHLAGDVFGSGNPDVEIGSAFLVAGAYDDVRNQDVDQASQIRANTLDEIINATSQAFLGMTVSCARCHDHKFDPIAQTDYYQLYATFAGVRHGERVLATTKDKQEVAALTKPLTARKTELEKQERSIHAEATRRSEARKEEFEQAWHRPVVDRTGTVETFAPVEAKFVRLISEARDDNPNIASGFRIDEFEVWSSGENTENVALQSKGAKATGAARVIEDFPGAYGAHHAIDGKTGERFMSTATDLTIELAEPTRIEKVIFSSAKGESNPEHRKFIFVADYRIEVSRDGETWKEVAHGRDRKPVHDKHRNVRYRIAGLTPQDGGELASIRAELAKVSREFAALPALPSVWVGNRNADDAKGPFHLFIGGSPARKGDPVVPASLSTLSETAPTYELPVDAPESERRLELADWIASSENPLALRVLANRLWHYHFGTGIVDTPNDFGYMGGRPTHPELLDYLAIRLRENDWKLKDMHRLIMTSQVYQQASTWREKAAKVDGDSRLLWRFPPRRLSAEEIRDTILTVSGKLDKTMGGPGFRLFHFMQDNVCTYEPLDEHGPETYRRAVYHQNARASVVDLMTEFDQPDCTFSAPERAETTTPLQALTLMNHDFTMDMAEALAAGISEASHDPAGQVLEAYRILYQRAPEPEEVDKVKAAIDDLGLVSVARALLNSSELIFLD
ncbi:MAG: DUF1553 domain-containing protein [Verrucomicrobiales bacterium]|nr:DUF1553 domain-containing protein [Verrucomicrobiales bacterium]